MLPVLRSKKWGVAGQLVLTKYSICFPAVLGLSCSSAGAMWLLLPHVTSRPGQFKAGCLLVVDITMPSAGNPSLLQNWATHPSVGTAFHQRPLHWPRYTPGPGAAHTATDSGYEVLASFSHLEQVWRTNPILEHSVRSADTLPFLRSTILHVIMPEQPLN